MTSLLRASQSLIEFAARSHLRALSLLVLVSLLAFIPGQVSMQPMDRDEPRFAQATKQMLETGDYVDIRFQDEARHKKPVGIYWLQAVTREGRRSVGCTGSAQQDLALPSAIPAWRNCIRTAGLLGVSRHDDAGRSFCRSARICRLRADRRGGKTGED